MIKLHWKNLGLKLAFSATTKIFWKETKLFNFTLFFPLTCISNIFGVYFVWLVVLSFCFGDYFSILLKQRERFNHEAPTTFQAMCFSPFIMASGRYLYKGSQVFSWEVKGLLWNVLTVSSFGRFGGIVFILLLHNASCISLLQKMFSYPSALSSYQRSILFSLFSYPNSFQL